MRLTRRDTLRLMGYAAAMAGTKGALGEMADLPVTAGPFKGTRESLAAYAVPDWFRDAKFGIWAHWGPQSAIEDGDWYARNMYMQDSRQYKDHVARFGHPSKVGYKDVVDVWTADKWDPDHLMSLYKKAGAKYFVSMGVHHDNFDLWNSKYQPRWNAVSRGPKKDVVGIWQKAAQKQGLKFGVSEHLWISYKWFATSHGSDATGPMAGVPYDGIDPKFADLYHVANVKQFAKEKLDFTDDDIAEVWKQHWFNRMRDLVSNYQPDLLYTDGHLPFEEYGLAMVANLYNESAKRNGGVTQAVYNSKREQDCAIGTCLLDRERGVSDGVWPNPWQTDTCIGQWHYNRGQKYKSAKKVIDLLVDIVSKNGNLLLNFPLPASGELDADEMKTLDGITAWMAVNNEGIYASRPWKIHGDGPAMKVVVATGNFNEDKKPDLTAQDVRFTMKGKDVFAFVMGAPTGDVTIAPLGSSSAQQPGKIANVTLLGYDDKVEWTQDAAGLKVKAMGKPMSEIGVTYKVTMA